MFKQSISAVLALVGFAAMGAAHAADIAPLPRDWSGLYGGLHVGVAKGLESSLTTSASASEKRSIAYCTNPGGQFVPGKNSEEECGKPPVVAVWKLVEEGAPAVLGSCSYNQYTVANFTGTKQQCDALVTQVNDPNNNDKKICSFNGNVVLWNVSNCRAVNPTYVPAKAAVDPTYECQVDSKSRPNVKNEADCLLLNEEAEKWTWNTPSFYDSANTAASIVEEVQDDEIDFLAGINAGYNHQYGNFVFGIEADISALPDGRRNLQSSSFDSADADAVALENLVDIKPEDVGLLENSPTEIETTASGDFGLSAFGTLRLRMGYAIDDRWLPFVTGGLAYGKISTEGNVNYSGVLDDGTENRQAFNVNESFGDTDWELGWTLGAGINYKIADNAFIGLTYLYTDLGVHDVEGSYADTIARQNGDFSTVEGSVKGEVDARFHTVRASFDILF